MDREVIERIEEIERKLDQLIDFLIPQEKIISPEEAEAKRKNDEEIINYWRWYRETYG